MVNYIENDLPIKTGSPQKMSIGVGLEQKVMDLATHTFIIGQVVIVMIPYHTLKIKGVKNDLYE